jgi:hypothetical protein
MIMLGTFKRALALGAVALVSLASPALAASEPSTRLVSCGSRSCLLVSGHRDNAASLVRINGHVVSVTGKRKWRVSLPVETVRHWSAPSARTLEVTLLDPETHRESSGQADLPIGLLGHVTDLASLVVRVR